MIGNELDQLYGSIYIPMDFSESLANTYYEAPTTENIKQSLDSLGYDVDTQSDRIDSIVNLLIYSDEWNVETAIAMMEALEDDYITELEGYSLLGLDPIPDMVVDTVDDNEDKVIIVFDDVDDDIDDATTEDEESTSWIEGITEDIFWTPFGRIVSALSDNIGERLEKFIANALGVELEE